MTTNIEHRMAAALAGLRGELLDCLQANLAIVAELHHGPGTYIRLGARVTFAPVWKGPLPTVDPGVPGRVHEACEFLGLSVVRHSDTVSPTDTDVTFVVADAWQLPWTPYYRLRHQEHSFLVWSDGSQYRIADGYHIDTPHGRARPGVFGVPPSWPRPMPSGAQVFRFQPGILNEVSPVAEALPLPIATAYADAYLQYGDRAAALDKLTQETWLMARARQLHSAYTMTATAATHAQRFTTAAREAYLAMRCVQRGRQEPHTWHRLLLDALQTEHDDPVGIHQHRDR